MLARKLSITLLLLAMLMSSTMLVLAPVAKCEGEDDPALLRLWADAGSYVGPNPDAWIHESWVVSDAEFELYIDAMLYPAYNVYLAVAVNDTAEITSITIGSTTLTSGDFTPGEVTWPDEAGGGDLPRHGVYPTWYALVPFGDIDMGWDYQIYPWEYWAYRESISVEIVATSPVKVHFDAQGVVASGPQEGKRDSSPFSHDLTFTPPPVVPPEATISGVKFHDLNANGIRDDGEEGLEGWTIELWFGGAVVDTDTTGADGDYIFSVGIAGTYQIREVLEEGWMQTAPIPIPPGYYELDVELGEVYTGLDFGNIMLGSISGAKFDDSNANGVWDNGEAPIEGWEVHLSGTDVRGNSVSADAWTDVNGKFEFDNLLPGTYTVTEVFPSPPPTWMATTDTSFTHMLTEGEDYVGPDFGNIMLGSISGAKFYDANVNGEWDDGELPIEGWKVHLTGINILSVAVDEYAFTDADGKFIFEDLLPGDYVVTEIFPLVSPPCLGYVNTTAIFFEVELEEGENYVGPDFGNVCLKPGYGGRTLGFWTNKNGQALITSGDVSALNALNLYKPPGWAFPPFSGTLVTEKTQIRTYLLSATAKDMRWMLSAQLIATKLNVLHGFLDGSTIVYVGPSSYVPSGFITIDDIMSNANDALLLSHPAHRAEQEYWKNLLDGVNNNRFPFVCPTPCLPIVYP